MTALLNIPNPEFFDNYSEAILITGTNGELLFINKAFTGLTGYQKYDLPAGMQVQLLQHHNGHSQGITKKDGTVCEVKITPTGINLADNTAGTVYTISDVSEVMYLQRKLERTSEELEQLAYVASHDLQEPLRTITSYIQLIQKNIEKGNLPAVGEFMKFVVDGASRMQGLISDLLQYSRITKKGNPFTEVDMNTMVKGAQAQLMAKITEYGAIILTDDLPKIYADATQINKLFLNILDNALKFRAPERQPEIKISVQERGDEYLFAVKDNGIGLEDKFYNRIFVIFQRLHARGEYEGTGLGLAVAKKIAERHGGEMWVESVAGEGSTFYFTLKKNIPA